MTRTLSDGENKCKNILRCKRTLPISTGGTEKEKAMQTIRKNAAIRSVINGLAVIMTRHGFDASFYFITPAQCARNTKAWMDKGYSVRSATMADVNATDWS